MTVDHEYFMRQALHMAETALESGELPIGAVVVLDQKMIASAHTLEKTQGRWLVHAELLALDQADRIKPFPGKRRAVRLYTTLEPCLMCLGATMSFQLGEVLYALESPGDGAVEAAQNWARRESDIPAYRLPRIEGGCLRKESVELFRRYVARHSGGGLWEWAKTIAEL